jgi:hypothetical protein
MMLLIPSPYLRGGLGRGSAVRIADFKDFPTTIAELSASVRLSAFYLSSILP